MKPFREEILTSDLEGLLAERARLAEENAALLARVAELEEENERLTKADETRSAQVTGLMAELETCRQALAVILDTALACDGNAWASAITKAGTNRPCDLAASALDRLGGLTFDGKVYRDDMIP